MNEEKKVPFKWEYGEETISLQLGMYANNQRLYIGMITHGSCLISLHLPNFLRFTVTLSTKENAIVLPSVLILEVHL